MGMKRLTYDAKGKHYCDYETREIINRLAECEIMLQQIEEVIKSWKDGTIEEKDSIYAFHKIMEVVEDGKTD